MTKTSAEGEDKVRGRRGMRRLPPSSYNKTTTKCSYLTQGLTSEPKRFNTPLNHYFDLSL